MSRPRVLVFDSGVGGLSVLDAIVEAGLSVDLDYLADLAWLPYGEKDPEALRARVPKLLAAASEALGAELVVIACNTATTLALEAARATLAVPVVGVVPPIKPAAAATRSGVIGVLATPATIRTPYLDQLIAQFAPGLTVVRCGAGALVRAAEARLAGGVADPDALAAAIGCLFAPPLGDRLDVVALSCTHFPHLTDLLAASAPHPVVWLDSGAAIARRVGTLLGDRAAQGSGARLRRACATAAFGGARSAFAARGFSVYAVMDARLALHPEPAQFG